MCKGFLAICLCFFGLKGFAQTITAEQYIEMYKDAAIEEMHRSGVPASITLAQGLLETENGNSDLLRRSNNHFGIKCKSNWTGESVTHTDDAPNECFRKYNSARESFADHSNFLKNSARYASLFTLDRTDYKGWAYGLKKAGYATNPKYPVILINNIEKNNLHQYDEAFNGNDVAFANAMVIDSANQTRTLEIAPQEPVATSLSNQSNTKFNGLKAVFANAGTSLLAIATRNNISLKKLLSYNDLLQDGLLAEDQWIYLESKNKEGRQNIYTVIEDETLRDVSQSSGVQLNALIDLNNISPTTLLKKGTVVKLKKEG